mmetsp:Transcript_60533/g.157079  ORF Transcript_60533/g.157079 Transcript_60533/m.157079 type:complete len:268 (+) Transcript_60533:819-1622(+)
MVARSLIVHHVLQVDGHLLGDPPEERGVELARPRELAQRHLVGLLTVREVRDDAYGGALPAEADDDRVEPHGVADGRAGAGGQHQRPAGQPRAARAGQLALLDGQGFRPEAHVHAEQQGVLQQQQLQLADPDVAEVVVPAEGAAGWVEQLCAPLDEVLLTPLPKVHPVDAAARVREPPLLDHRHASPQQRHLQRRAQAARPRAAHHHRPAREGRGLVLRPRPPRVQHVPDGAGLPGRAPAAVLAQCLEGRPGGGADARVPLEALESA